jgi:hypothetical protein
MRRLACMLLASALSPSVGEAVAGMLLEAELAGTPIRVEVGGDSSLALANVAGASRLLDLGAGAAASTRPDLTLEQWSEGPIVAEYGTTYHVLIGGERICGEVLASSWMAAFTEPLVRAIELLQSALPALAPQAQGGCGAIGFRSYAANGFPLLAGYQGRPVFRVTRLRFDHYPAAGPLAAKGCAVAPCPPDASAAR